MLNTFVLRISGSQLVRVKAAGPEQGLIRPVSPASALWWCSFVPSCTLAEKIPGAAERR